MRYLVEFYTENGTFIDAAEFDVKDIVELEEEAEYFAEDLDADGWEVDYWTVKKL